MFCEEYRTYDIEKTAFTTQEAKEELLKTSYATYVYKHMFKDKIAAALVFDGTGINDFYDKLSDVKKKLREYIRNTRKDEYYVDTTDENWRAFKHFKGDGISQLYLDDDKVKLAYLNGVHLEEKELFEKSVCYTFLVRKGIIHDENSFSKKERSKADEDISI